MNRELADVLFVVTALVYFAATSAFMVYLLGSAAAPRIAKFAPRLIGVGAVLHATHIVVYSLVLRVCPVEGIHFPMSVAAMLACGGYVLLRSRWRIDVVGAFVAPLALTTLMASRFVGGGADVEPHVKSAILPFHVTMNLLGVALFSLAFAAAALYLVQEKLLKAKRVEGLFQRLPPLDSLDQAEHKFLLAGFPLLTLGIITGTLWARRLDPGSGADVARTAFGYVTWLLFAGVLLLRAAAGWRGRRAAYGTIAGFGFAMLVIILYLMRSRVGS
jgi:ABC-type uncharacterized transport system permease subunit